MLRTCYDIRKRRYQHLPFTEEGDAASHIHCREQDEWTNGEHSNEILDVRATLAQLSSDDRLVLVLFYGNDLPVREIAEMLGITEGAARVRLSRARARFKKAYISQGSVDGAEAK